MAPTLRWRSHGRQAHQHGFSLIEMLAVVGILAILLAIALPRYGDWRAATALQSASETLMAHLKQARIMAVSGNRKVTVQFATNSYTVDSGGVDQQQYLLSSYSPYLTLSANKNPIYFYSGGTSTFFTVTLTDADGDTRAISVNMVGRASYQ